MTQYNPSDVLSTLTALTPLDGRYHGLSKALSACLSELALVDHRILVEANWLATLATFEVFSFSTIEQQESFYACLETLTQDQQVRYTLAARVKEIEADIRHDVKSVEVALGEYLSSHDLQDFVPYVHFCMTSEDVNNLAWGLMLNRARKEVLMPTIHSVIQDLETLARPNLDLAMVARTHGQLASPTTLGKELAVFCHRLARSADRFQAVALKGKCNGATGNFNAHSIAFPSAPWPEISRSFVTALGLDHNPITTQIESGDTTAEYLDALSRINSVLLDLCKDMWGYISLGYFKQKINANEVGSSTMPHKVNPIDFENAEGNLGMARTVSHFLSDNLTASRWQRDLTGSTTIRNLSNALGHSFLAWEKTKQGLSRVQVNPQVIEADLTDRWELLSEPMQSVLRTYGDANAYDRLKQASRSGMFTKDSLVEFLAKDETLDKTHRDLLSSLSPSTYVGYAAEVGKDALNEAMAMVKNWEV